MKRISLSLILILGMVNPVSANEIKISDTVDIYENNKYYPSVVNAVDNMKIINVYPDHTFRGEKLVDKKELCKTALKVIKFIENEKRVSLKKKNQLVLKQPDIKDKEFSGIYKELNNDYSINFIKNIDKVNPQEIITMRDFIITANQIIELSENVSTSNPYESMQVSEVRENIDTEKLIKLNILDKNIKLDNELNRYELAKLVTKLVESIKTKS